MRTQKRINKLITIICYSCLAAIVMPVTAYAADSASSSLDNQSLDNYVDNSLNLNGAAVHSHLQLDYYYAALFSEQTSDNPDSLFAQNNMRMEFTVLVDEWSKRQFTQYWNQSIAINNSDEALDLLDDELVKFNKIVRNELRRGDRIFISKVPDKGTTLAINGVNMLQSNKEELFTLFLKVWIGQRPPSSGFKSAILGKDGAIDPALVSSYQSLSPSGNRKDEIKSWLKEITPAKAANTDKQIASQTKKATSVAAIKKAAKKIVASDVIATKEVVQKAAVAEQIAIAEPTLTLATLKTASVQPTADTAVKDTTTQAAANKDTSVVSAEKLAPEAGSDLTSKPNKVEPKESSESLVSENTAPAAVEETEADSENLLLVYHSNLLALTNRKIIYPSSAIQRNRQGKVVLKVLVNRAGEVQDVSYQKKSRYASLNKAASVAVTKSSPFPGLPEELVGDDFEFLVPINFNIDD